MTSSKMLIDTNVLRIAAFDISHQPELLLTVLVLKKTTVLCVTLQNLAEFWNVATRPTRHNGFGRSVSEVALEVDKLTSRFQVLPETPKTFRRWRNLVERYEVTGVLVHDVRLAAIMQEYGLARILTLNTKDFTRFPFITPIHPLGETGHV